MRRRRLVFYSNIICKAFPCIKVDETHCWTDFGAVTCEGKSLASLPSHSMWTEEWRWRLVACHCGQVSAMVGKRSVDLC